MKLRKFAIALTLGLVLMGIGAAAQYLISADGSGSIEMRPGMDVTLTAVAVDSQTDAICTIEVVNTTAWAFTMVDAREGSGACEFSLTFANTGPNAVYADEMVIGGAPEGSFVTPSPAFVIDVGGTATATYLVETPGMPAGTSGEVVLSIVLDDVP